MKIARWTTGAGTIGEGFVIDDQVVPFGQGRTVADILAGGLSAAREAFTEVADAAGTPLAEVDLLAPLQPAAIRDFTAFEEHVEGMSADEQGQPRVNPGWYEAPAFYFTNHHIIHGTGAQIRPPQTQRLDYELEVAAVLGGEAGENLSVEDAAAHIFGYVIMNDWSARDLQIREMQVHLGPAKGKDFGTSLGPWIVTADEVADALDDEGFLQLRAEAYINGRLVGEDLLSNMSWTFPELISYASRASRVVPGDVIGSGTVGNGGCLGELWGRQGGVMDPPPLVMGDEVTLRVERLGELTGIVGPTMTPHPLPAARRRPKPRARTTT